MPRMVPRQHRRGCRTGGQREARASSPNLVKAGTPRSEDAIITPAPHRTLILVKVPCSIVLVSGAFGDAMRSGTHERPRQTRMIILMTLLIAGASMALAVHQWWRGYDIMAIGLITFALVMAGVAIEAGKDNQNAEAPEVLRQP